MTTERTGGDVPAQGTGPGTEVVETAAADLPVEPIVALLGAVAAADGVEALGEQPVRALRTRSTAVRHLVARSGDDAAGAGPLGYAQLEESGEGATAELAVDPTARGRGVGAALLAAVLDRAPDAAVWAHGDLPAAGALAGRAGLRRARELLKMLRDPADGPAVTTPDAPEGVELGTLAEAASEGGTRWPGLDARAELLRVNNAAFDWHPEQGGWTAAQLDERLAVDWVDPAGVFLAVETGESGPRLLGFHWTKVERTPDDALEGEVYVVGVDPAAQGRRLGTVLTRLGVAFLERSGADHVTLYVEGDNLPARRTYERLGFRVVHTDVTYSRARG